ncbi:hypothetical protein SASPL_119547 [Salvia splendens]|uniref:CSN8/PSMD8/EIF3K domain-containing protein n=1 Tax=Salvia splendens TaxID=180675 RepID=A0A8X8XTS3_SALSN|nr:hypothetical protein SASPL_119547 [Salvia splendens]
MDFSTLNEALAFKSYDKVADICDSLMFQAASEGVSFQEDWPYAIHLIGHIYINDINSARFLWKKIPLAVKESQPEVPAAWKIGQRLWIKDYASVHEAIREFIWSPQCQGMMATFSETSILHQESSNSVGEVLETRSTFLYGFDAAATMITGTYLFINAYVEIIAEMYTKRMFELLQSAYSTISIQDTARFLGMNEDDAKNYVVQHGWTVDPASRMLTVKKQTVVNEQKLDHSKLQRLTEYVFHLEH